MMMDPPSSPLIRTAMSRLRELAIHSELAYRTGTASAEEAQFQIAGLTAEERRMPLERGANFAALEISREAFEKKIKPVHDAMMHLYAELDELSAYTEFLQLHSQYDLGPALPESMRNVTCNPKLLNQLRIEEYRGYRNCPGHQSSMVASAMKASVGLNIELKKFSDYLESCGVQDTGYAFIKARLIPRMGQDLEYLDETIHELSMEAARLNPSGITNMPTIALSRIEEIKAIGIEEQAARAAAAAQANGAVNVVSIFSGPAKGKA